MYKVLMIANFNATNYVYVVCVAAVAKFAIIYPVAVE